MKSDAIVLPGVGAFGDAMRALNRLDLIFPIRDYATSEKPVVGICLGFQLLFSESYEFGFHKGLNIIPGEVIQFAKMKTLEGRYLKVPQICWNRIYEPDVGFSKRWQNNALLSGVKNHSFMYFVNSYYGVPEEKKSTICNAKYGEIEFCAGIMKGNVTGFQFHPERSGYDGIKIYRNLSKCIDIGEENGDQ